MKLLAKYLIATLLALLLVSLLAAFGNLQLSQSPSSAPNFSAYPLPGTPTPKGSAPIATPTRLAAYPGPGAGPSAPTPRAPGAPLSFTPAFSAFLPLILQAVGPKGTAGIITSRADLGFTNEITMGVQWGYNWNTVYSKTSDVYSSTFPYQVVNDVRSTFRASIPATITSTPFITWNTLCANMT